MLAVDYVARRAQEQDHASASIKWPAGILLIDQCAQFQVALVFTCLAECRVDPTVNRRTR